MPENPLVYLADDQNPIPQAMRTYFTHQGYYLKAYNKEEDFKGALLIFAPLWDGQHYQSPEGVWANYLSKKHPSAKLIVLSNLPVKDPNYVDLFDLPADWPAFLSQAPTAELFETEKPVFTGGMDMEERLLRFLKGHGNESLMDICKEMITNLRPGLKVLANDKDGFNTQETISTINSLTYHRQNDIMQNRWLNYQSLFVFMPFQGTLVEMNSLIHKLNKSFETIVLDTTTVKPWLTNVVPCLERLEVLLKELERYVRS